MTKCHTRIRLTVIIGILTLLVQGCVTTPHIRPGGEYLATTYGLSGAKRPWPHRGEDYATPIGTPVLAPGDGEITSVSFESQTIRGMHCGGGVRIWHTGTTAKHMTWLCHMNRVDVKVGDHVRQGQVIGTVGATGCRRANNCFPHLHFEVRYDYQLVRPSTRIGGCYKKGSPPANPDKPLVYPVRC